MNIGPVAFPRASIVPIPAVTAVTSRVVFCQGVTASVVASLAAEVTACGVCPRVFVVVVGVGGGVGRARGTLGIILPFCVTIEPRTTSSSRSIPK